MAYSPMYSRQRADFVAATEAEVKPLVDEAQAWAEGTLPGGAGTKSAKEWAEEAETSALAVRFGLGNIIGTSAFSWLTTYSGAGAQAFGTAGLKVVSGQTGGTTSLSQQWNVDGTVATGRRVRMVLGYTQSATFTRTVGAMALQVRLTNNSVVTRTTASGTTIAVSVVGNRRVYTIEYVMQGDEAGLRPVVGVSGATPTASDETISLIDYNCYYLTAVSDAATAGDETLTARLTAVSAASTAETTAQVNAVRLGLGNIIGTSAFSWITTYGGGAVALGATGVLIPAGQTGVGTFVNQQWAVDGAANTGKRVRIVLGFTQSATFTRTVGALAFQVRLANNSTVSRIASATVTTSIVGTRRVYTVEYTLQGDETGLRPLFSLAGSAAASDETVTLTDFNVYWFAAQSDVLTASEEALNVRLSTALAAETNLRLISSGNIRAKTSWLPQYFNGAVVGSNAFTVRIPAGSTGQTTIMQVRWPYDGAANTGNQLRFRIAFDQSATFTRMINPITFQVRLGNGTNVTRTGSATIATSIVGSRRVYTIDYTIQGDEAFIQPFIQIGAGSAAASDETITFAEFSVAYRTTNSDIKTSSDESLDLRFSEDAVLAQARGFAADAAIAYTSLPALVPDVRVTVAPSGGAYTRPDLALAAITDAALTNRYQIDVRPGLYQAGVEFFDKDWIDIVGSDRDNCVIDFAQPNNASAADIALFSAMYLRQMTRLEGVTVRARNARYAIHHESSNLLPNRLQEIINCRVEHLGNDAAINNTWLPQFAVGAGVSSGQVVRIRGGHFYAKNFGAYSYHTNVNFADPSFYDVEGASFICDAVGGGIAFRLEPLGSGQRDRCRMVGNVLGGDIVYRPAPWLPTTLAQQPADHCEIDIYGYGNSPAVFRNLDTGQSLRIESATSGPSSSVAVSGNAVRWLFGDGATDRLFSRDGTSGFRGSVWGWGDVSGQAVGLGQNVFITSLGQRLGDCTSVNKTLTVTVDGGSPITITFDQNYTAQSNATILDVINAALGSAAVASTFQPGQRYRPRFSDEEIAARNTSASGIRFGTVCAFDASAETIRPMTSADPASRLAGVAWEDIPAGTRGRVKSSGWLPITDILRTDSASFAFGDTFSIDAGAPGKIVKGGSQGLLMAIRSDAVKVG